MAAFAVGKAPPCNDTRDCRYAVTYRNNRRCRLLTETYEKDGQCPFRREGKKADDKD